MIAILRAADVSPDPRVEKLAATLVRRGEPVLVVGWARGAGAPPSEERAVVGGHYRIVRFTREARHGRGLSNLMAHLLFQIYMFRTVCAARRTLSVIHACDLSTGLTGLLVARMLGVPLVYDIFDYYADSFPVPRQLKPLVRVLERWVIEHACLTIITNEARRQQIAPAAPRQLIVIHNSPDIGDIRPSETSAPGFNLCYVGILAHGRMLPEVLQMVSMTEEVSLTIGGFGPLEGTVKEFSNTFANITFLGRIDYGSALSLANDSDAMLALYEPTVPNHKFASPNKFYEALALGKPLVVVRGTGIDEEVRRNHLGVVVEAELASLTRGIHTLRTDHSYARSAKDVGASLFAAEYSWAAMEQRLNGAYDALRRGSA